MSVAALILTGFAFVGTSLVAVTHSATRERIAANERAALLANLNALVPPEHYDNRLTEDVLRVRAPDQLGSTDALPVYRARLRGEPVAAIAVVVAPDGYAGPIKLLVGIHADGTLTGVRTLSHQETPGLGDAIDVRRSDWILGFAGRALGDPPLAQWAVRKDGGAFDQFTGATITPRAVVAAVKRFVLYFQRHRDELFASLSTETPQP